jgi:mannonate dehydratase
MGYYFGLAGVWGHWRQCDQGGGRGDAGYKSFDYERVKDAPAIPVNEVWGGPIPDDGLEGTLGEVTLDEMWGRIQFFLENLIPVAEEEGVRLAAHPDDPPVPTLRKTARLLTSHDAYRKLTELVPSQANALEFCQGTVAEMGQDIYDAIRYFGERDQICYVHFRNVRGDFPTDFDEVFIDEGDVNMIKAMQIYKEVGFEGTMIPDHSPRVTCQEPWHAGMAFALGYMRAAMQMVS